jgi:hypothetical protein
MAVANGVSTAKQANGGMRNPETYNGKTRVLCDKYVFPADVFAAADFIKIGTLPIGAVPLRAGIRVGDTGTTGAFSLGTEADPDGFIATGDSDGAAGLSKASTTEAQIGQRLAVATDVRVDCTEVTDDAEGVELFAWVEYIVLGE